LLQSQLIKAQMTVKSILTRTPIERLLTLDQDEPTGRVVNSPALHGYGVTLGQVTRS
jgi:hypothetical protein